jgi:hypothetical protein
LEGRTPEQAVTHIYAGTKIADSAFRRHLLEGGEAAIAASQDPMIMLARRVDPIGRELVRWERDNVESVETSALEKLAEARFAVYGKAAYPDATFTLRLAYGTVKGYSMNGTQAPPFTTLYGLYDRAESFKYAPPFDLPRRFAEGKGDLDLSTHLNFVCTCDITGGNSGSPVINRDGEIVGVIFDGNIESLAGNYFYDESKNRAIAIDTAVIGEALRKLYGAVNVVNELERGIIPNR